jgi:hypothetical protein
LLTGRAYLAFPSFFRTATWKGGDNTWRDEEGE